MSPYILVYGKACHLPIELQLKAFWVVKKLNFNLQDVGKARMLQLNKLEEHKFLSYENDELYKEKTKKLYESKCQKREIVEGKMSSCSTQG